MHLPQAFAEPRSHDPSISEPAIDRAALAVVVACPQGRAGWGPEALHAAFGWALRCLASIAVAGCLVATVVSAIAPIKWVTVLSPSMTPTYPEGSLLMLAEADAGRVAVGDVIAFGRPGVPNELVTHRVAVIERDANGDRRFATKGDANRDLDPWWIPSSSNIWTVQALIPGGGTAVRFIRSMQGRILIAAIPALLVLGRALSAPGSASPTRKGSRAG